MLRRFEIRLASVWIFDVYRSEFRNRDQAREEPLRYHETFSDLDCNYAQCSDIVRATLITRVDRYLLVFRPSALVASEGFDSC